MKIFPLALIALVSSAGLAHAQVDEAAKAKLQQMADAVKQAHSVSYRCEFFGRDGFMAMLPTTRIEVTQKRNEKNPGNWLLRAEGRRDGVGGPTGAPAVDILVVGDGPKRTWIDTPSKTVYERTESQANGDAVMSANLAAVRELMEPEPFSKEFGAPSMKSEAGAKADGVDCDVIVVDKGPNLDSTKWTIGKSDHLPRLIERTMQGVGTQVWKLSDVKLNPDAPDNLFTIATPDGFKDSRMATPAAPAAPAAPGVTSTNPDGSTNTPPPGAPRNRMVGTAIDNLAPDFELPTPAGEKVKLSSLRGNIVLLDFWGTWCLPCKKASPEVQKLTDDYKGKPVKIFGIAVREPNNDKPAAYMSEHKYTYGLLLNGDEVATDLYKVKAFPSYVLIGQEGQILRYDSGYEPDKTFTDIRKSIEDALGMGAKPRKPMAPTGVAPAGDSPAGDAPAGKPSGDK